MMLLLPVNSKKHLNYDDDCEYSYLQGAQLQYFQLHYTIAIKRLKMLTGSL